MAEFNSIQELLDDFKDNVIREAKRGIPRDTGTLANSLKGYVKESKNSIQISFEMDEYGFYKDQGVKGNKSSNKGNGQNKIDKQGTNPRKPTFNNQIRCNFCNKPGHIAKNCWSKE